eukprot:11105522-Ditylum_brightwellii.AAC.1
MASAAEAEVGTLFTTIKKRKELCTALKEMGHKQPPTPIRTDNTTANEIVNDTVRSAGDLKLRIMVITIQGITTLHIIKTYE